MIHSTYVFFLFCQINTNGLISFGNSFTRFNPGLFPIIFRYLVAPFWSDVDISRTGSIRYQVYSNGNRETEIVSQFISEENFIFTAEWMLIVEWNRVPQFGRPSYQVNTTDIYIPVFENESPRNLKRYTNTIILLYSLQTNTFQTVLATDGSNSFALFIYKCGDLDWNGRATVGYGASTEMFSNHRLSRMGNAILISCLNAPENPYSTVTYLITGNITKRVNYRMCFTPTEVHFTRVPLKC